MNINAIPNILTILRIFLLVPFCYAVIAGHPQWAFWLFFFAGLTDLLDGYIARHFKLETKLGAFLDPIADKLLMGVSYLLVAYSHYIPMVIVFIVLAREVGIAIGMMVYYRFIGEPKVEPALISKINTCLQILLVGNALLKVAYFEMPQMITYFLWISVPITTIWSFMVYVQQGISDYKKYHHEMLK